MRLVGIDIGEREVRVARGERTLLGAVRLVGLERIPAGDPAAVGRALAVVAPSAPHVVLTALPALAATHRLLDLPFRGRRLERTVALELLGHLPIEPAGARVAFRPVRSSAAGTSVLAAVARQADVDALAGLLAGAGLPPASIDLAPLPVWNVVGEEPGDAALVVADGARCAVSVRRAGAPVSLRALGASSAEPDVLAREVRWSLTAAPDGIPDVIVLAGADAGPRVAAALAGATGARIVSVVDVVPAGLTAPAPDLAACAVAAGLVLGRGRRSRAGLEMASNPDAAGRPAGRVAGLAAAAVLLGLVDLGLVRHGLARREAVLARATGAAAAAALPGVAIVAPRAQLEAAVASAARLEERLGGPTTVLETLRDLSALVPATIDLDVDELAVERDAVLVHGRCDGFDGVDAIRRALAASALLSDVKAEETRTTVDGRRVEFRMRATRRAPAGARS